MRANALARPEQTQSLPVFPGRALPGHPAPIPSRTRCRQASTLAHTDTTLRLTRAQYRQYAEQVKAVGKALNLATYTDLGGWGEKGNWGLAIIDDAAAPPSPFTEKGLITLSTTINTKALRRAGINRPECDWSQLADAEMYPFIVAHEIGHVVDNFGWWAPFNLDRDDQDVRRALAALPYINEVLADRWAWQQVCQRPMPLTAHGKRNAQKIEEYIDLLTQLTGGRYAGGKKALPGGQYRSIPEYMLATPQRAKWIGPDIHPETLRETVAYHAAYEEQRGYALWRPRPTGPQVLCNLISIR